METTSTLGDRPLRGGYGACEEKGRHPREGEVVEKGMGSPLVEGETRRGRGSCLGAEEKNSLG